jgi:hypothetical protein
MKCLRKVFLTENNEQIVAGMNIDPKAKRDCEAKHRSPNEQAICKRISMAGFSGASMFAVSQNLPLPKFDKPDPSVVSQTYESHPQYQCRLDTYFNGAVCDVSENEDFSATDPKVAACNKSATVDYGFRPQCWFKPTGGGVDPDPTLGGAATTPNVNGQTSVSTNNINNAIPIKLDVSNFNGAKAMAFEVSKPNQQFSNPNGTAPDQANGHLLQIFQSTRGTYNLIPAQHLPGWGTYQIRVIALDASQNAISKNSNSFILNLKR